MGKGFIRDDWYKKKRLSTSWRKPRGVNSKRRLKKGKEKIVSIGYGSPKREKNQIKGKEPVRISNLSQLSGIKSDQGIVISGKIGAKKRCKLIQKAVENKIMILNIKDAQAYLNKIKELKNKKSKEKEEKEKAKVKKEVTKPGKESIEDKLSEEEKKELEKKEVDRLLTKKF
ncbi:hypothetical protein JW930_00685 [Candidatus Woesearchaeota archaeon]|nr:hypothetical protein [Candidatus Woesearchaeota archaeon]